MLPGERVDFATFAGLTVTMARRLHAAGIGRGDRVGLLNGDSIDALALLLGAMRLGAVPVPVNARYKARELSYVVENAGMHTLVVDPAFAPLLDDATLPGSCEVIVGLDDPAFVAAGSAIDDAAVAREERTLQPGDPALILYTSGTTANPKGCVYAHGGVAAQAFEYAHALGLTPDDRLLDAVAPLPRQRARHGRCDARDTVYLLPRRPAVRGRGRARPARARALHRRLPRLRDDLARAC